MFEAHDLLSLRERRQRALGLLREVGLPDPERIVRAYPHQLSGGQRQRAMIAMALALEPAVLVADEPTTALDVTTQAQILELLDELKRRLGTAILLITHDLGVVAQTAQRVVVMYAGRVVEEATVEQLFSNALHPYTRGLLSSLPRPEVEVDEAGRPPPLSEIAGMVPPLADLPAGCHFAPRCAYASDVCIAGDVRLKSVSDRAAACLRLGELPWTQE